MLSHAVHALHAVPHLACHSQLLAMLEIAHALQRTRRQAGTNLGSLFLAHFNWCLATETPFIPTLTHDLRLGRIYVTNLHMVSVHVSEEQKNTQSLSIDADLKPAMV